MDDKLLYNTDILAERLTELRKGENKRDRKFTQEELCGAIGNGTGVWISTGKLSRLENGNDPQTPNINFLLAIAKFFNVTVDYLIGESNSDNDDVDLNALSRKFGLSKPAMDKMKDMNTHTDLRLPLKYKKCGEMKLIPSCKLSNSIIY